MRYTTKIVAASLTILLFWALIINLNFALEELSESVNLLKIPYSHAQIQTHHTVLCT